MTRAEALRVAVKYLLRAEADANTRKINAKTSKALAAVMEEHAEIMQAIAVIEGMLAQKRMEI